MKILIPVLGFDRTGGYRVLSEFANRFVDTGHTVDFLVPTVGDPPYFPVRAGICWVDYLGNFSERPTAHPAKLRKSIYFQLALFRGLQHCGYRYDVVLANHSLTAWPVKLARCGNAKKFYYIQAYEPEYYSIRRKFIPWALSKASYGLGLKMIVNAPLYRSYKNIHATDVVPPGIDLACFHPKRISKRLVGAKEIVLGCIGRREPSKGIRYVLEAFETLWRQDTRFRLKVAYGNLPDGWSHPACNVEVPRNDNELSAFYRSLDILVAPGTIQHGAPHYPVMEAMACGVPVVTTGYRPADPTNSWIVENSNAASIVSAISDIVSNDKYHEKVHRALEDIAPFDWPRVALQMVSLLAK
jgi:glycosyltransferase involved in cell wall biosynthesis